MAGLAEGVAEGADSVGAVVVVAGEAVAGGGVVGPEVSGGVAVVAHIVGGAPRALVVALYRWENADAYLGRPGCPRPRSTR